VAMLDGAFKLLAIFKRIGQIIGLPEVATPIEVVYVRRQLASPEQNCIAAS
jgi:hypothetical protein